MENSLLADVRKIAFFRPSALGDFIFALPAIEAIRRAYPDAEIVYLGRDWHTGFVPGRLSGPHRVIAIPSARSHADIIQGLIVDPVNEADFVQAMRSEHFDLALQMHGAGRTSTPFLNQVGARHTAGLRGTGAPALERWVPYGYYQNETVRLLEAAALVGGCVPPDGLNPSLPVLPEDLASAAGVFDQVRDRPYCVIHPGSTDPRRCWSPQKFAQVGDFLASQGLVVVLVGTSMDSERAKTVELTMRAPVTNLCDRLTLSALVGVLSRASLFVGNDSGPLHLALATGGRAVGLFWTEYIINSLPLTRRRFTPLIAWQRICPRCGTYCEKAEIDSPSGPCTHEVSFVEEISPESVIYAIQGLLTAF